MAEQVCWQMRPLPLKRVTLEDAFWRPRQEANKKVTVPHVEGEW